MKTGILLLNLLLVALTNAACTKMSSWNKLPLTSFSRQVTLGNVSYYVPPLPVKRTMLSSRKAMYGELTDSLLFPFTLIHANETKFSALDAYAIVDKFDKEDDVYSEGFSKVLFINSTKSETSTFAEDSMVDALISVDLDLPQGPYFASYVNGELSVFEAYRLYADSQAAFQLGIVPDQENGGFTALPGGLKVAHAQTVAVPSRLYFTPTEEKPLSGYRIALKDLYDVKGIKTSGHNRAYFDVYDEAAENSFSVQKLIDLGAVIVGKLKLDQFANLEYFVDFHAPFNPRGDGYQSPSSSSCGSGAAEAAYDWLDVTLGSDTTCSVRCPAMSQGLFGIRPTWDAISLEGLIPMSPLMDTAGYFTRDAELFNLIGKHWYGGNENISTAYSHFPSTVLTFTEEESSSESFASEEVMKIYNSFLNATIDFLGATHETLDVYLSIQNATGETIADLFNQTSNTLTGYYQYFNVYEPLREAYQQKHNGDTPFVDALPLFRFEYGYNQTEAGYNRSLDKKHTVDNWFNSVVTPSPETCSSSIYIYLSNTGSTSYINGYPTAPTVGTGDGYSVLLLSSFARTPEVVVPLAEVPYNSTITLTEKFLPVTATIGAAPGCDFMVLDLVSQLQESGILRPVKVGSRMY